MQFGHYELIHEIGRGGMGVVWRARDEKVGREVAIKILPQDLAHGPDFRERFEREARTVARLEHSAIVPIYDVGEISDQPYIAMRLMPGGSLADVIRMGPMSPPDCLPILQRVGDALNAAHEAGIVHRDVKPGNILFDSYNAAHLSDFGIVKVAEGEAANITETGKTLGTPAYMAPEMAETGIATPQVDIYALGITLYYMLSGQLPFGGTTPVSILMAHIKQPIPNILAIRPDLNPAVKPVLEKAIAKDPNNRYQSAPELGIAFADALASRSVSAAVHDNYYTEPVDLTPPSQATASPPIYPDPIPAPVYEQPTYGTPIEDDDEGGGIGMFLIGVGVIGIVLIVGLIAVAVGLFVLPGLTGGGTAQNPTSTDESVAEVTDSPEATEDLSGGETDSGEVEDPTATYTSVVDEGEATATIDTLTLEGTIQETLTLYEEARRYLLETLDDCCIADIARGEALTDRLNAVSILQQAGDCTWDYDFEGMDFERIDIVGPTEVEAWVTKYESGTVFCGGVEQSQYAFNGPTIVYYELDLYTDGWYVTLTDNVDEVGDKPGE